MGSTVQEVKARWKYLRDTYRRVLKNRARSSKSGAPADDVLDESTKWLFFYRLMFLKDTMEGRPTSGNLGPLPPLEAANNKSPTVEPLIQGMYEEGDTTTVELADPPEASASEPFCREAGERPPPKEKPRRTKCDHEIEGLTKFLNEKPDEHEHFGAFLAEKMRTVPHRLVDAMQLDLLQTLRKYTNETQL
ncbi:hypothetical protein HPB50_007803 [Hyalomma asiaticum]|uniref:Uncharacterized protein n=1 Tax=Hyalomma asiaticum TaxID=266040 RepID=A0ACB7SW09_HYAAI|nr:hypothetical protein HPB50_007803 [Hyalomma asiaticum]